MTQPSLGKFKSSLAALILLVLTLSTPASRAAQPSPERSLTTDSRTIQFAGVTWGVRDGFGSPGPHMWSDSPESVWVDEQSRLHLKLRQVDGVWHGAEIFSYTFARHGPHRFQVIKENPTLDQVDPNLVLGLFLYKVGCGPGCQAELDIEISRWRNAEEPNNAQYVAQPSHIPGNLYRFPLSPAPAATTHVIYWEKYRVGFSSYMGLDHNDPDRLLNSWSYTGPNIPRERDNMMVILNLWMDNGEPPLNEQETEVIIAGVHLSTVCRPAAQIACGETVTGNTSSAATTDQLDKYPLVSWPEYGPEVAYGFIADSTGPVTVQLKELSADLDLFVLNGSSGACSSVNAVAFGNEVANFEAQSGKSYYVVVDGWDNAGASYQLQLDCSGETPPSDPQKVIHSFYLPVVHPALHWSGPGVE